MMLIMGTGNLKQEVFEVLEPGNIVLLSGIKVRF